MRRLFALLVAFASSAAASTQPLPSRTDGVAMSRIVEFVLAV